MAVAESWRLSGKVNATDWYIEADPTAEGLRIRVFIEDDGDLWLYPNQRTVGELRDFARALARSADALEGKE